MEGGFNLITVVFASISQLYKVAFNIAFHLSHLHYVFYLDKWREESLKAHNHLRKLHHSPPLVWSNSLAKKAKNLANALAAMDFIGSQDLHEEKGENIAQLRIKPGEGEDLAQKAVDLWSKEENSYSYSYPQLNPSNRHFIQMIWKKTRKFGMASTGSRSGENTFVVALYGGPGVDHKLLRDNVLRAGKKHDVYTTFKRSGTARKKVHYRPK